jgi:2-dehydro-3-deoxyphosphogluconate aldolase/(4S)-4-hydroxy-2-oxoglutarate aldolase
VVPVVVVNRPNQALKLAELFTRHGLSCIEVTLRTENALPCIEAIVREFPEAKVGVGSVVTPDQLHAAEDAGIDFAVSPGTSDELLAAASRTPWDPGAATASEVMQLKVAGYRLLKFFPAELLGGAPAIRALSEPIRDVQLFPTSGIRESNLQDYLSLSQVACVGGSWLAPSVDIEHARWDDVEARCLWLQRTLETFNAHP